jgi:hypothetical protein
MGFRDAECNTLRSGFSNECYSSVRQKMGGCGAQGLSLNRCDVYYSTLRILLHVNYRSQESPKFEYHQNSMMLKDEIY